MNPWALVQLVAALACAGAAGLLWSTRIRLERRLQALDDERLQARDAQAAALAREAEALRDLTPVKIREYLVDAQAQLKRYCRAVEAAYREARREIERCDAAITRLQERGEWRADEIDQLVRRREALLATTRTMQPGLGELQHQCEFPEPFTLRVARLYPETIQDLAQAHQALTVQLGLEPAGEMPALAERVAQSCKYRLDEHSLFSGALYARPADPAQVWQRPDNGE
jgi:DNA repair exonuclease SbcCD ATPase subunit